jgi:hypothetical protein
VTKTIETAAELIDGARELDRRIDADDLAALLNGEPPSFDVEGWVVTGLRRSIESGESLERTLGLTDLPGRGWRDLIRQHRTKALMLEAAAMLPTPTTWAAAKLLRDEIRDFRRYRWSRLRDLAVPPSTLSDLEQTLFWLFKTRSGDVTEKLTTIHRILTSGGATAQEADGSFGVTAEA